jgi:long-subunit acyl-CoA synthetase (AMP-forming)
LNVQGDPKGAMIRHGNVMASSAAVLTGLPKEYLLTHEGTFDPYIF